MWKVSQSAQNAQFFALCRCTNSINSLYIIIMIMEIIVMDTQETM